MKISFDKTLKSLVNCSVTKTSLIVSLWKSAFKNKNILIKKEIFSEIFISKMGDNMNFGIITKFF